jgi:hypothetical protein
MAAERGQRGYGEYTGHDAEGESCSDDAER